FMEVAGDRWWAVSGGVYFLHAVKRVHGMRLIKPQWNERLVRKLMPVSPKVNSKITQRNNTDTRQKTSDGVTDMNISHSTRPSKDDSKVAGYVRAPE
ncbi:MAG: hypothetical protein WAW75_12015, partial [Gallionella sp.]